MDELGERFLSLGFLVVFIVVVVLAIAFFFLQGAGVDVISTF